jgi:hypothetical protein
MDPEILAMWKVNQGNQLTDPQVYPPQSPDIFLHEYVLAGWGMPIGKLSVLSHFRRSIILTSK